MYDDSLLSQIANENGCVNPNDEDHTAALEVATQYALYAHVETLTMNIL